MNLLIYCDEYPPAKSGGIGSVTKIIAENLSLRGHKIVIIGSYEYGHNLPFCSLINGVKVYRLTHYNFLSRYPYSLHKFIKFVFRRIRLLGEIAKKNFLSNEFFIENLIDAEKIECIELVDYIQLLADIKGIVSFKMFKVPTTLRIHGSVSFLGIYRGNVKKYQLFNDKANFERTQFQTAVSDFSKEFVVKYLNQNENLISVIHNPIEDKLIVKYPQFKRKTKDILFLGKITDSKGAFQLIKAFNIVGEIFKDWNIIMIGGGDIEKATSLLSSNLRNRVKFTGYLSRYEVIRSIDNAAFCIIPSFFENFAMAPLEVMARGKALIYTNLTSGPEIISDWLDGLLINPKNLSEIVNSISLLIRKEQLAEKLAINGYNKVRKHFTTKSIINSFISHYSSLINNYKKN